MTYDSVSFDGNVQAFNDASGPSNFALRWYPPGLQVVNFQIGGDNSSQGTTAYLDSFSVTGSAEPVSSGWRFRFAEVDAGVHYSACYLSAEAHSPLPSAS